MELEVLKKKLSTFRGEGGRIRNVSDDILLEVLSAWENWTGTAKDFYKAIGSSSRGMASMIGKAKRLKRERYSIPFEEVNVEGLTDSGRIQPVNIRHEGHEKIVSVKKLKVDKTGIFLK